MALKKEKRYTKRKQVLYQLQTQINEQSTEAINMKPTSGTAPGTQLSGEVSYFFVSPSYTYFDKPKGVKLGIFC